jgi:hypothetical protein
MLNANEVKALLANATPDTVVHLEYRAGKPATSKGIEEFEQARDWNKPATAYVGHFGSLKANRWGELVLTVFCHNRGEAGKWRAFNPSLGTILSLKVEA